MMKKAYFILIFFLLLCNIALQAQRFSMADSVIYYLRQVKGLQSRDSAFMKKAHIAIYKITPDSLPVDKIDVELKKLIPVISKQNYFAFKVDFCDVLTRGKDIEKANNFNKSLIAELKNYSGESEKNLLLWTLIISRLPYRNTNRINVGVEYYQRLANDFEQARDSDAASKCYWSLSGFYRTLGLMDKTIYCSLKSMNLLNRNAIVKRNYFLWPVFKVKGLRGFINTKINLGSALISFEEPQKALTVLYETKAILNEAITIDESIKDSIENEGPFLYHMIINAKLMTGGDSVNYYFDLWRKTPDLKNYPISRSVYYQELGYYFYLQNRLDSAEYFIRQSAALKDSLKIWFNSTSGYIIPGYYLALIKMKQNKYNEAIKLLKDESNELLKVNLRKEVLKEWKLLSSAYEMIGDYKSSNAVLKQYNDLQKQIIDDENRSRSMSFETEQQINSLNAEKKKQDQEIKRQKFIRNLIIGGLVLMLIFSIIFLLQRIRITKEKKRSEGLLLNILPSQVAEELKQTGRCQAKTFSMVTVMFMDFKDFTSVSEKVSAELLVDEINFCFSAFDNIIQKYRVEKIKTVGDAYICVGGLPVLNYTHAFDIVNAAIEIRNFMLTHKIEKEARGEIPFELRIGIHTGPVVAGIVGVKKFQYDIWGDTVNLAARMESSGEAGHVNISGTTYALVKDKFNCTHRGRIQTKNKGEVDMYFVESII